MKVGDLVQKTKGDADLQKIGIIISIDTNPVGYTFCKVLINGSTDHVAWLIDHIEIFSEHDDG